MDIRKIKKLIELLEESGIAEIEIKEGEEAVRISRMPAAGSRARCTRSTHGQPAAGHGSSIEAPATAAPAIEGAPPSPNRTSM